MTTTLLTSTSVEIAELRGLANAAFDAGRATTVDPSQLDVERIDLFTKQPLDRVWEQVEPKTYEDELSFKSRIRNENKRIVAKALLAGVRNDAFQYLMRCETMPRLSVTGERIFDRHRERVDRLRRAVAPEVLDMLNAAIHRSADGDDPEARVHVVPLGVR